MRFFLTIITCFFAVLLKAQSPVVELPYNPDSDNDELIGTTDLLELLSNFGLEWEGSELTIDSIPLSLWITSIANTLQEQGDLIDSLLTDGSPAATENHCGELSSINYHGTDYPIGSIGNRCWFLSNLNSPFTAEGEAIGGDSELAADHYLNSADNASFQELAELEMATGFYGPNAIANDDICPSGWHVGSESDYVDLAVAAGAHAGFKLASADWFGSSAFGFNAQPSGVVNYDNGLNAAIQQASTLEQEAEIARSYCNGEISEEDYLQGTPFLQAYFEENPFDSFEEACYAQNSYWFEEVKDYLNEARWPAEEAYSMFLYAIEGVESNQCSSLSENQTEYDFDALNLYLELTNNESVLDACMATGEWQNTQEYLFGYSWEVTWEGFDYATMPLYDVGHEMFCSETYDFNWPPGLIHLIPDFDHTWYCNQGGNNGLRNFWDIAAQFYDDVMQFSGEVLWQGPESANALFMHINTASIWGSISSNANYYPVTPIWIENNRTQLQPIESGAGTNIGVGFHPEATDMLPVRCVKD